MVQNNAFKALSFLMLLLLSFSVVSAGVITISDVDAPAKVFDNNTKFDFTFKVTYTGSSEFENITFSDSVTSVSGITVSASDLLGLNGSAKESKVVTGTVSDISGLGDRSLGIDLFAKSLSSSAFDNMSFNVALASSQVEPEVKLCRSGEHGTLQISDFEINNNGEGEDDEWFPLDEIEIVVEVENTDRDDDVRDVLVEMFIFEEDGNDLIDVTSDFDLDDEEIDLGRVNEDDTEEAIFMIDELPADLDEGDYRLYFKVYSEDDEDAFCVQSSNRLSDDDYEKIEYTREDDEAVVVRSVDLQEKIVASCGDDNVLLSLPVYNLGTDKEDNVLVNVYNSDFGFDEYELIENLRSGKKETVDFFFDVPEGLDDGLYKIDIITYFQYDDGDELEEFSYDSNSKEDLDKSFRKTVELIGCSAAKTPSLSARLASSALIGEELVIELSVKNNGADASFDVEVEGFSD